MYWFCARGECLLKQGSKGHISGTSKGLSCLKRQGLGLFVPWLNQVCKMPLAHVFLVVSSLQCFGKALAPYRFEDTPTLKIGQKYAKTTQKIRLWYFLVYFCPILLVAAFHILQEANFFFCANHVMDYKTHSLTIF